MRSGPQRPPHSGRRHFEHVRPGDRVGRLQHHARRAGRAHAPVQVDPLLARRVDVQADLQPAAAAVDPHVDQVEPLGRQFVGEQREETIGQRVAIKFLGSHPADLAGRSKHEKKWTCAHFRLLDRLWQFRLSP